MSTHWHFVLIRKSFEIYSSIRRISESSSTRAIRCAGVVHKAWLVPGLTPICESSSHQPMGYRQSAVQAMFWIPSCERTLVAGKMHSVCQKRPYRAGYGLLSRYSIHQSVILLIEIWVVHREHPVMNHEFGSRSADNATIPQSSLMS